MHEVRLCDACEGKQLAAELAASWKKNRRDILVYGGGAVMLAGLALVAAYAMIPKERPGLSLGEVLP